MAKKPTREEIIDRILKSGVDAMTNDEYINAKTPMIFYCSQGHKWSAKLGNITHCHQGCPFCSGRMPIIGETDLWTTRPDVALLLLNREDGYKLMAGSGRHVDFKCPNCGAISNHILVNICKRGFSCSVCSDGISYPNKFMASCLEQLKVKYTPEYIIDGASYRYDFYLNDYNTIVEMHGRQHYEEWNKGKLTLADIQNNDVTKKDFAIKNGVDRYISIDSKCSDINYISSRIKISDLNDMFNLSVVDWFKCGFYAAGSLVYKAAELYNSGYDTASIAVKLNVSKSTVYKWLTKATELKLCNWIKDNGFINDKHPIVLLTTKEYFNSISDGGRKYNVPIANIAATCQKKREYAGVHPITGEPLVWRYIEDYNDNYVCDFMSLLNSHVHYRKNAK